MAPIGNFERIGLNYSDLEAGMALKDLPSVEMTDVMGPAYWYECLSGPNGEELWVSFNGQPDIVTVNPMFDRGSYFRARIDTIIDGVEPYAFSECDVTMSILESGETITRMQAIMVNMGSRCYGIKKGFLGLKKMVSKPFDDFVGEEIEVRISMFAQQIDHFETEEAYFDSQPADDSDGEAIRFSSTFFAPSGLFPDEDGKTAPVGFGTGPVKECGTANSVFGGPDYHWAIVGTLGGDFGVVWAPQDGPPAQKGYYLSYAGTLIARWQKIETSGHDE